MSLSKLFQRIIWHNNTTPAINEDNLNAMSKAIDDIDDRVILIGDDVVTVIPQIQAYLEQAESIVEAVEELSQNPPYIGANGNWYVFDTTLEAYKDSGVDASITVDIADITMIAEGAQPYVTNTGTNTDPVFHLFIPRGQTGTGITSITKTASVGNVDTYTITFSDGNTTTFDVTNGSGSGDMRTSVYDSDNAVADAGGITDYVADKVEPMLNVLGAKNLLNPIDYHDLVALGVTSKINSDGTISLSGTATITENINITAGWGIDASNLFDSVVGQEVILSDGTDANTYVGLILMDSNGAQIVHPITNNGEVKFTISQKPTTYTIYYNVVKGVDYTGVVLKPMMRLASIADDTYEPYSMTNQQLTPYALSQSNPNLLDNPWFTVNQRGESSYSGAGYTVDRWKKNSDGTIGVDSNGLTINAGTLARQAFADFSLLNGKTVTISVLYSNGNIDHVTTTATSGGGLIALFDNNLRLSWWSGEGSDWIVFNNTDTNNSITIRAVKLELGSVSTLAQDTAPNYATELLKCQRYFYRMNTGEGIFQRIGIARASTATAVEPQIKLPTTMRSNPSVTVGGNITAFNIIGNGSSVAASSYSGTRFYGDYKKILFSAASNLVVNELYSIEVASTAETDTTYIDFSADL